MSHSDFLPTTLTKNWFVLRHGRSEANEAGIVASQLANAGHAYGLTEGGKAEVADSVKRSAVRLKQGAPLRILMSPFLRTRQTAAIAGEILGVEPELDGRLVERDFGDFELLSDDHYQQVWDVDAVDPESIPANAETVYSVVERTVQLVKEVDSAPAMKTCLIVTHCDVAMILTCAFRGIDPRHHRSLDPIKTGEVRRLNE